MRTKAIRLVGLAALLFAVSALFVVGQGQQEPGFYQKDINDEAVIERVQDAITQAQALRDHFGINPTIQAIDLGELTEVVVKLPGFGEGTVLNMIKFAPYQSVRELAALYSVSEKGRVTWAVSSKELVMLLLLYDLQP